MQIQDLDIKSIKAYSKNPRKNDAAVDAVAASVREFGWKQPLVIDPSTMEIVAGHTRYKAAKKLGCKTVPCVMADDLTAEQIKAYRLADNKTAELAEWDFNALEAELFELSEAFDMDDFGFDIDKISADEFGDEFSLPDDDKPAMRTITLTLCEQQYDIVMACHDWINDNVSEVHCFDGKNDKSNAIFEVIYQWAEQKKLL